MVSLRNTNNKNTTLFAKLMNNLEALVTNAKESNKNKMLNGNEIMGKLVR